MKTNIFKLIIFLLILAGGLGSCEEKEEHEKIPYVQIGKGDLSGLEELPKQDMIIRTKEEWGNLKAAMNSVNSVTNNFSETEIDFDSYQIVAVFDEVRYSGGWEIVITEAIAYSEKIVVIVKENAIGRIAVPTVINQPFHIVKIPVTTKKIEFNHAK